MTNFENNIFFEKLTNMSYCSWHPLLCCIEWYHFIHDYKFICWVLRILSKHLNRTSLALCVHRNEFLKLRTKSSQLYSEYKTRHGHTHKVSFETEKEANTRRCLLVESTEKAVTLLNSSLWQFGLMSYLSWCSYILNFLSCPLSCLFSSISCP